MYSTVIKVKYLEWFYLTVILLTVFALHCVLFKICCALTITNNSITCRPYHVKSNNILYLFMYLFIKWNVFVTSRHRCETFVSVQIKDGYSRVVLKLSDHHWPYHSSVFQFSRSCVGGSKYLMSACPAERTDDGLRFESRFESGNLAKVVQITETYYELYLRTDMYTNRHMQWFYFRIENTRTHKVYR